MRKTILVTLSIIFTLSFAADVYAAELYNPDIPRVVDNADVLLPEHEAILEKRAAQIFEKYGMDFVIYTDDDAHGKDIATGADDFYDEYGYGSAEDRSGSLLYVCFDPSVRSWYTSTCGKAIDYFDYDNINIIDDAIESNMQEGDFSLAFMIYADYVDQLYAEGTLQHKDAQQEHSGNNSIIEDMEETYKQGMITEYKNSLPLMIITSVVMGIIIGLGSVGKAESGMKTVEQAYDADNYDAPRGFNLTRSEDIFLTMTITRVPKPEKNDNNRGGGFHSGGSTFTGGHFSGGGTFHSGGGGRHF